MTTNQTDIQSDPILTPSHVKYQMIYFDDQPNAIFQLNVKNSVQSQLISNV